MAPLHCLPDRVGHNVDILGRARTAVALFAGAAAGLLGLTGLFGFAMYLVVALACDLFLQRTSCGNNPDKYLPPANRDFFTLGSLTTGALSFVLSWLIFYNVLVFIVTLVSIQTLIAQTYGGQNRVFGTLLAIRTSYMAIACVEDWTQIHAEHGIPRRLPRQFMALRATFVMAATSIFTGVLIAASPSWF